MNIVNSIPRVRRPSSPNADSGAVPEPPMRVVIASFNVHGHVNAVRLGLIRRLRS